MARDHIPSTLPPVDRVEVVDVSRLYDDPVKEAASVAGVVLDSSTSELFAELWRSLPDAEQMRCHTPPFVVRLFQRDTLLISASLCWSCNNAHCIDSEGILYFTFDGQSAVAQDMLAILRRAIPGVVGD